MKTKLIVATAMLTTVSAVAFVTIPFTDWDQVVEKTPDIVVASCWNLTPPTPGVNDNGLLSDYQVEILSVLKGTNDATSTRLLTKHELQKGGRYLVLGHYSEHGLDAYEDYRVIQMDKSFRLESLTGKTLDEKLQILFESGVDNLKSRIQEDEEEKDRLQEAVHK